MIQRSLREAGKLGAARTLSADEEPKFWHALSMATPRFLEKFGDGVVVRVSTSLTDCGKALASVEGPGHAHAASGVVRGWFSRADAGSRWMTSAQQQGWKAVVEFSSGSARRGVRSGLTQAGTLRS